MIHQHTGTSAGPSWLSHPPDDPFAPSASGAPLRTS